MTSTPGDLNTWHCGSRLVGPRPRTAANAYERYGARGEGREGEGTKGEGARGEGEGGKGGTNYVA